MERSRPVALGGGFVVDLDSETLRDAAGGIVALRPQAGAVLRYLAANADRVVGKDELMAAVWPGIAVTDDSLVQAIGDIRRSIGDGARAVLRTVPRRGYKLVPAGSGRPRMRRRRWWAAALTLALAAAGAAVWVAPPGPGRVPLVAVLPFEATTGDARALLLARGLTGDVITDLGRIPELEVLARGATAGYAGRSADPRAVGAALGAGFVVEGSIGREADRVRVTAQLVDAGSGRALWSDRWDWPAADLFAVQSEIAATIANRLGGGDGLVQQAGRAAARRKPPASLNAYELYLLGTERLERLGRADVDEAIRLLDRAVAIDPDFARAWVELSHAHGLLFWNFGVAPAQSLAPARAAAERALALDPGDAEAHIALGKIVAFDGDHARVKAEFDAALQLAPNAAEILTFYAGYAPDFGSAELGAEVADRAVRLEPNFPMWKIGFYAYAYFMAGRYEDALAMIARHPETDYAKDTWPMRAGALAALGRLEEARAVSAKAAVARPDVSIESLINDRLYSEAVRARFLETLRPAGYPACAAPDVLAQVASPRRLPECVADRASR